MPAIQRGSLYRVKGGWGIRWLEGGRRRHRSPFPTRTAARAWFDEHVAPRLRRGAPGPAAPRTLAELADAYLRAHALGRDPNTIRTLRERLARPLAAFGDVPLADLERRALEVAAWSATIPDGYRYQVMQAFRQVLDAAVRWRLIVDNPVRAAGSVRPPRREEIRVLTPAEVDAIADELGPRCGPLVRFAAATGLRPQEWAALERRDVDRAGGVVLVRRTVTRGRLKEYGKTERSRRRVPLSSRALEALDELPPRLGSPLLFPAPGGGHIRLENFRRRDWRPAVRAAGFAEPLPRIYDLRHSFASWALAAGLSIFELARYMGASVRVIDAHYGHLVPGSEARARRALDAWEAAEAAGVEAGAQ